MNRVALVLLSLTAIAFYCVADDTAIRAEGCGCHDPRQPGSGPHQTGSMQDHILHLGFLGSDNLGVAGIPGDQGPITAGGQHGGYGGNPGGGFGNGVSGTSADGSDY